MGDASRIVVALLALVFWAGLSPLAGAQPRPRDLTELGVEELMSIEITSVAKREQKLLEAPAAIYVITQEDIQRTGATSLAEALRMVPGVDVARIDANKWAISSRGFNSEFASKMLVLIDGRSVYTPLFSGVYWDVQDTLLEDVERIEVIRGPAGTLWGANAVNGVINVITKSARDTQGGLLTTGGGTEERAFGGVRYGGRLGTGTEYRVYLKYFNRDEAVTASGDGAGDDWSLIRGGFRLDWRASARDSLTVQGDLYTGTVGQNVTLNSLVPPFARAVREDTEVAGANLLARWTRTLSAGQSLRLQAYYDRTERQDSFLAERRDTVDLDFQHTFRWRERHEFVWGLGYRYTADETEGSFGASLDPRRRGVHLLSTFVQDEITLIPDYLRLTLGSKFEHNDYSGFEVQPNVRLTWTPDPRQTVWAAVSRAVRTPSRAEHDVRVNTAVIPGADGLPTLVSILGNRAFESEEVIAYELGYRIRPADALFLDIAAFYNTYDDLRAIVPGSPFVEPSPPPPHGVLPIRASNALEGEAYGVEVAATWTVTRRWRLAAGYAWFESRFDRPPGVGSADPILTTVAEGDDPHHQFHVRSYLNLPWNLQFDAALYHVSRLTVQRIPSYTRLDLRLAWRPTENLDVSLVAQNLLDDRHPEFGASITGVRASEVQRSVFAKLTWRF